MGVCVFVYIRNGCLCPRLSEGTAKYESAACRARHRFCLFSHVNYQRQEHSTEGPVVLELALWKTNQLAPAIHDRSINRNHTRTFASAASDDDGSASAPHAPSKNLRRPALSSTAREAVAHANECCDVTRSRDLTLQSSTGEGNRNWTNSLSRRISLNSAANRVSCASAQQQRMRPQSSSERTDLDCRNQSARLIHRFKKLRVFQSFCSWI